MFNHDFDNYDAVALDHSLCPSSFTLTLPPPLLTIPDQLSPCFEFDSASNAMKALNSPETPHNNSSGGGRSCISSTSCANEVAKYGFMPRSCSTLSLQKDSRYCFPFGSSPELADARDVSVRRVCSTGDLQRINGGSQKGQRSGGSQLMSESNMIIEELSRTSRYSPEEKKERIKRYRSKRTQRNFNKKIKYACRKTLADSRQRIRGRFARNDEIEKTEPQLLWNHGTEPVEEEEEEPDDYNNWVIEFFDAYVLTAGSN